MRRAKGILGNNSDSLRKKEGCIKHFKIKFRKMVRQLVHKFRKIVYWLGQGVMIIINIISAIILMPTAIMVGLYLYMRFPQN